MNKRFDANDQKYKKAAPRIKRKHIIVIRGSVYLHRVQIKIKKFIYYFYVLNDYVNDYRIYRFKDKMALAIRLTGSKRGRVYIIDPTQIILPYEWDTIRIKYGKKNRKIIGKCMALLASVFVRMFNNSITF